MLKPRKTKKPSVAQPIAGQERDGRSPNCRGRGFPATTRTATAAPMKIAPWTANVADVEP